MTKHSLTVATTYYKTIEVEAETEEEARDLAYYKVAYDKFDPTEDAEGDFEIFYDYTLNEETQNA